MNGLYDFIIEYLKRKEEEQKRLPIQIPIPKQPMEQIREEEKKTPSDRGVIVIDM